MNSPAPGFDGPTREFELSLDPVVGLRAFKVDRRGRLTGIHQTESVYRPGVNVAECGSRRCNTERIEDCACGYYAYFAGGDATQSYLEKGRVGGIVRGYGRTVVGDLGFRATRSDLVALFPLGSEDAERRPSRFRYLYPTYRTTRRLTSSNVNTGWSWATLILLTIAAVVGVIALSVTPGLWPLSVLTALYFPWGVGAGVRLYHSERTENYGRGYTEPDRAYLARCTRNAPGSEKRPVHDYSEATRSELFARLRVLYPDTPVYRSRRAAVRAHALSVAEDYITPMPGPDTDPEFWGPPVEQAEQPDVLSAVAAEARSAQARARR